MRKPQAIQRVTIVKLDHETLEFDRVLCVRERDPETGEMRDVERYSYLTEEELRQISESATAAMSNYY